MASTPKQLQPILALYDEQSRLQAIDSEELVSMRLRLRDALYRYIIDDPHPASASELDQKLWRAVFYEPIVHWRKAKRHDEGTGRRSTASSMLVSTISCGIGMYVGLLKELAERGVYPESIRSLLAATGHPTNPTKTSSSPLGHPDMPLKLMIYRMFICLGDLFRYAVQCCPEFEGSRFAMSRVVYEHAIRLCPQHGNAYNQSAVVASFLDDVLDTIYFYLASLSVDEPFAKVSLTNLESFVKKDKGEPSSVTWAMVFLIRHTLFLQTDSKRMEPLVITGWSSLRPLDWIRVACVMVAVRKLSPNALLEPFVCQLVRAVIGLVKPTTGNDKHFLNDAHLVAMSLVIPLCPSSITDELDLVDWPDEVTTAFGWQDLLLPFVGRMPETPEAFLNSVLASTFSEHAGATKEKPRVGTPDMQQPITEDEPSEPEETPPQPTREPPPVFDIATLLSKATAPKKPLAAAFPRADLKPSATAVSGSRSSLSASDRKSGSPVQAIASLFKAAIPAPRKEAMEATTSPPSRSIIDDILPKKQQQATPPLKDKPSIDGSLKEKDKILEDLARSHIEAAGRKALPAAGLKLSEAKLKQPAHSRVPQTLCLLNESDPNYPRPSRLLEKDEYDGIELIHCQHANLELDNAGYPFPYSIRMLEEPIRTDFGETIYYASIPR